MDLFSYPCPFCGGDNIHPHSKYLTQNQGTRMIHHCRDCDYYYSDTYDTPIAGLRTPLSRIIQVLKVRSEGMGLNATARSFGASKKSIIDWEWRLAALKPTLMLYTLLHEFISLVVEGDELYTKVERNTAASDSQGWTIVLMERGSRFLFELRCGRKDKRLFEAALTLLAQVIEKTENLTLLTDGERRYGNLLFTICHQVIHDGQPDRPQKFLRKGVRVRLKNKGAKRRRDSKRSKYQAPVPEHPQTSHTIENKDIHANHVEAFNASLRRHSSAFRRKTNTYAKKNTTYKESSMFTGLFITLCGFISLLNSSPQYN
jgi:transposase-like protein